MSKVRMEIEVPIPPGTNQFKDTNPSAAGAINIVMVSRDQGRKQVIRLGRKSNREGFMHPNDEYFRQFGGTYNEYVQNNPLDPKLYLPAPHAYLSIGLYAIVLIAAERLGLYSMLIQSHGIKVANAAMDYVMFLIRTGCNSVERMTCELSDQVMFCNPLYSDSWYSDLFSRKDQLNCNNLFMDNWIKHWIEKGISEVYISIDGSNIDCESRSNPDAERGKDKSGQHTTILSFMWVVVASGRYKGMPLAYVSYQGSQVDCAGIKVLLARLSGYGLRVVCAVLDRGFCTGPAMNQLQEMKLPYVIMMTSTTGGHQTMVQEHGDEIRSSSAHYIGNMRYGTVDRSKVFKRGETEAFLALVYDPIAAAMLSTKLVNEVYEVCQQARLEAEKTGKEPTIPNKYKEFLRVEESENENKKHYTVRILCDVLDAESKRLGFTTLASSENLSAKEVSETYDVRASSELAYEYLKTPLGGYVIRVHAQVRSQIKMFYSFISVVIYNELQVMCSEAKVKLSSTIPLLDRVQYLLTNGRYVFSENFGPVPRKLLKSVGITGVTLRNFASEINKRYISTADECSIKETKLSGSREHIVHSSALLTKSGSIDTDRMGMDAKGSGFKVPAPWNFEVTLKDLEELEKSEGIIATLDNEAMEAEISEEEDKGCNVISVHDLSRKASASKESKASGERDLAFGELQLKDQIDPSSVEKQRRRGRPRGSKDKSPRHRRTFEELGKETKRKPQIIVDTIDASPAKGKRGRKPGSKDSYKRTRRTKAQLQADRVIEESD